MLKRNFLCASSAIVLAAASAGTALAQAQQAQIGLEEITVTARRVEENLMQVPLAISAMSASDIQSSGVRDLNELARLTPGLVSTPGSSSGRTGGPANRGGGQLTFRGLSVANGLSFVDGAPYSGGSTPDIGDVARVEVLKGPQSVYFGRSTYSGAVNYVSREPGDQFHARVSGDLYSYGGTDMRASLEGPFNDKISYRVSGRYYHVSGQYPNPIQGNRMGEQQTTSITGYMVARPSDPLKIAALFTWQKNEDGAPAEGVMLARRMFPTATPNIWGSVPTGGELTCNLGGTGGAWFCGQLPSGKTLQQNNPIFFSVYDRMDGLTTYRLLDNPPLPVGQLGNALASYPTAFDTHWLKHFGIKNVGINAHIKIDYDLASGWSLNSITAYHKTKSATVSDFNFRDASLLPNRFYISATATPLLPEYDAHPTLSQSVPRDWSQELRVTSPSDKSIRGTLGGSYLRIASPKGGLNGYGVQGAVQNNAVASKSKTPAVFGALYFDFAEKFTFTAEARYQWDAIYSTAVFPIAAPTNSHTYTSFSPRVSLDYKFADNSLAYALFSRGYRPGGFNTALIGNIPSVVAQLAAAGAKPAFDQEKLDNFEVGIKATWLDNRLQTIIDGYYDKWSNGQVNQSIFVQLPTGGFAASGVTVNNGRVTLSGIEFEARYAATEHLLLAGSLAYMHNKIDDYLDVSFGPKVYGGTNASGYVLPGAPKWTFSFSPQYTAHAFGDFDWFTRVDYSFRGGYFLDTHNIARTAPLHKVNLHVGLSNGKLRVEAYANNLFDDRNISEAGVSMDVIGQNVAANGIRVIAPVKRIFGLKASYEY